MAKLLLPVLGIKCFNICPRHAINAQYILTINVRNPVLKGIIEKALTRCQLQLKKGHVKEPLATMAAKLVAVVLPSLSLLAEYNSFKIKTVTACKFVSKNISDIPRQSRGRESLSIT